jgi:hypothetical protein
MPIRPELRRFYGREWHEVTRPRILKREGHRCKHCRVPNHTDVRRTGGYWLEERASWKEGRVRQWRDTRGRPVRRKPAGKLRRVRIVLCLAHLNNLSGDDRDENLAALCQWCHLTLDRLYHKRMREERKDRARPLLSEALTWGRKFEASGYGGGT